MRMESTPTCTQRECLTEASEENFPEQMRVQGRFPTSWCNGQHRFCSSSSDECTCAGVYVRSLLWQPTLKHEFEIFQFYPRLAFIITLPISIRRQAPNLSGLEHRDESTCQTSCRPATARIVQQHERKTRRIAGELPRECV